MELYLLFTLIGGLLGLLIDDARGCFPRTGKPKANYTGASRVRVTTVNTKQPPKSQQKAKEFSNLGSVAVYQDKQPKAPKPKDKENLGDFMVVKKRPSSTQPLESSPPSTAKPLNVPDVLVLPVRTFEIPASLLLKLNRYTHDRDLSERLVKQVAEKNPSQDGKWCAEKALWDLERDRK